MLALIIGIVTIAASFGAAWLGAWLQRQWTPDPTTAINAVETRVEELRQPIENVEGRVIELRDRVNEIEQDRADRDAFRLGIQLRQATLNGWIVEVRNETAKGVCVETIQFFDANDAPLSDLDRPTKPDEWCIPPGQQKQLWWKPQHDPIMTMKSTGAEPHSYAKQYRIVLGCRSDGKPRTAQRDLLLTYRDNTFMQYGP